MAAGRIAAALLAEVRFLRELLLYSIVTLGAMG